MQLRKITAGAIGLLMTGSTLMGGALAGDLANYATTFDASNTLVVVGSSAAAADIVGGINVAASLAQIGASSTATATTVTGGKQKEVALRTALSTDFGTLKDNDLAGLIDTQLTWNGKTVDVEETITVTGVKLQTSYPKTDSDEKHGEDIVLATTSSSGSITYSYIIDDSDFNYSLLSTKPITISFLGTTLKLTKATDTTTDKITYEAGTKAAMGVGDTVTVNGKTVKVTSIGSTAVSIDVDGEAEIVTSTASDDEIGSSGIKVTVEALLYTDDVASRQVQLLLGSDTTKEVGNGDSLELLGEPESTTDAEWIWYIDVPSSTSKLTIGAKHNQKYEKASEPVAKVGGSMKLPNDYATITFDSLTASADRTYTLSLTDSVKVKKFDNNTETGDNNDYSAIRITSDASGQGFKVNPDGTVEDTDTIYLVSYNSRVVGAFKNSDGDVQFFADELADAAAEGFNVSNEDILYTVTYKNDSLTANEIVISDFTKSNGQSGTKLNISQIDITNSKLGAKADEAEGTEVNIGTTSVGTRKYDLRTEWGSIVRDPNANGDTDEVVFVVPPEQIKGKVTIAGPSGATTTTTGGVVQKTIPSTGVAKLASEVSDSDKAASNLILVGGPCANSLVADLAAANEDVKACSEWTAADQALLQVVDDAFATGKAAIVVAGWSADDTRRAANALQNYKTVSGLSGAKVVVGGSSITSPVLSAPVEEVADTGNTTTE